MSAVWVFDFGDAMRRITREDIERAIEFVRYPQRHHYHDTAQVDFHRRVLACAAQALIDGHGTLPTTQPKPAFPSFLGIMVAVDPTLAEGVIEFRDNDGNVLGTLNGVKK